MARVTVEDCILNVPNRFELVILAASRAKKIAFGAPITLPKDNDKDSVISLREIAEKTIAVDALREEVTQSFRKRMPHERHTEDTQQSAYVTEAMNEAFGSAENATQSIQSAKKEMGKGGMGDLSFEDVETED